MKSILDDIKRVAKELGHTPSKPEYYSHGKFKEWQIRKNFGGFSEALAKAGFKPHIVQITKLEAENDQLRAELSEAQEHAVGSDSLRTLIGLTTDHHFGEAPDWLKGCKGPKRVETKGIPNLFLSDIHFDEVVAPSQVDFMNEYNHSIATKRIQHTFKTAMELLKYHMVNPKYDGIVLELGGDMFSGNIHEELAETNHQSIAKSLLDLTDLLITGIGNLADEFGKVFVPCVVGNHGRMHKKPRAKNRVFDNYEWLMYQYLARHFKSDGRITFLIPDGADAQFSQYHMNFLLTHGDQFKGGSGIAGIFSPLMLGMARKQKRQSAVNRPFDVMMMGHWHQYIHANQLIVNGSIKGLDEYAYIGNFGYERPKQALFIVHPDFDITFRMPVLCDSYESRRKRSKSILSW